MKVSVIVTSYNLSLFIEDCIASVLNQTRPPDEVIIADDCSTDDTVDLARKLCPTLIVVKQERNGGALLNTLSGVNAATGEVLAFIDGDDTWPPEKLERVATAFRDDPGVVLVTHGHRRVDAEGRPSGVLDDTHANIAKLAQLDGDLAVQSFLRRSVLMRHGVWFGSAYSVRRASVDLAELNKLLVDHPDAANGYLDLVMAPFVVGSNPEGRLVLLHDVVFDYRIHGANSATSNTIERQMKAVERGRATNAITRSVLSHCGVDNIVLGEYEKLLKEYDYLEALYRGKFGVALGLFARLAPFFMERRRLGKELARTLLVGVFGPRLVVRYK